MRRAATVLIAAALALAACGKKPSEAPRTPARPGAPPASRTAAPAALPERKPGVWVQKVSAEGRTQVTRICLDAAVERRFTVWGQHAGAHACSQTTVTPRPGGGWDFASSCDLGDGGKTVTEGVVTGDFAKAYKVRARSSVRGANAQSMNGLHEMTLQASWQGPCPASMKAGDVLLPGGTKINMLRMPEG